MEIEKFDINDVILFKPRVFTDDRGYFFEAFNQKTFNECVGYEVDFVQDNQSQSQKGTVRGLHFQSPPFEQGKLVSVVKGAVIDFLVDIRTNSLTYGDSMKVHLSENDFSFLWIPPGFAHGFCTLEDNTIFQYKCSNFYNKDSEGDLKWDDSKFGFGNLIKDPIVSEKDKKAQAFTSFNSPF
ncbi:MAG: dTDP-4-dehydrorhamnose 3,5-epimerase [Crocinitomicaceae bacterium]